MCVAAAIFLFTFIMSEELQLQVAKLIDKGEEAKKRAAWGGFGVQLYHTEISLQLRAQKIITGLIAPTTAEQIKDAETALAITKKAKKELQDDRIEITTNRFKPVLARLMKPEEAIDAAIAENEAAILKAKQAEKEAQRTKENKEKELKQVAEQVRTYIADMHFANLNAQAKLIADAYQYGLDTNISASDLPEYLLKIKARITVANRTMPAPLIKAIYNTQADVDAEILKHFNPWTPKQYIDGFAIDVANKFDDWDLALKNKEQAKVLNTNEYQQTVEAIADEKGKETVSAKLEAIATPIIGQQVGGKPLKEVYVIPEPQTMDEAFVIINAFIVNQKLCMTHVGKIKPINFGVKQMIGALEAVKKQDEAFAFTGLAFKQIEKL